MVLAVSALGVKHLASKIKQLLQEPAKELEFDTGETEQKALIEASDIVTTFARLAKIYGSCSYSRPSSVEMFKMVSLVVLWTRRLEASVKDLENQRDDKDAFKRVILAKAGSISRGDIRASTTCLTSSSEQYPGLIIDNSFFMEDDGGKSADLGPNPPENLSHSPAVRTLKPSPEIVSNLYYSNVVLQCQTASLSGQVYDC